MVKTIFIILFLLSGSLFSQTDEETWFYTGNVGTSLNEIFLPVSATQGGWFYFDGSFDLIRGDVMRFTQFKRTFVDTVKMRWMYHRSAANRLRPIVSSGGQNAWMISGAAATDQVTIFTPGDNLNRTFYTYPNSTDTNPREFYHTWNILDSTLYTYVSIYSYATNTWLVRDSLASSLTEFTWSPPSTAYTTLPFQIGCVTLASSSLGGGTIPTSAAAYLMGGFYFIKINKYFSGTDSAINYTLNSLDDIQQDSLTWQNSYQEFTTNSASRNLVMGLGLGLDSSHPKFQGNVAYTSELSAVAGGLWKHDGTYWNVAQVWGLDTISNPVTGHKELLAVGDFTTANVNFTAVTGTTMNGISFLDLDTGTVWRNDTGVTTGSNIVQKGVGYGNGFVVCGAFSTVGGVANTLRVAQYSFTTGFWTAMGTGLNNVARALYRDGSDVYCGGTFTLAGGVALTTKIAKWNGSAWSAVDSGFSAEVEDITMYNSEIIAVGKFTTSGSTSVNRIARLSGGVWTALGTGADNNLYWCRVFNGELYTGGTATTMNGLTGKVWAWNGSTWRTVVSSTSGYESNWVISGGDVGNGKLLLGGQFAKMNGKIVNSLSKLQSGIISPVNYGFNYLGVYQVCSYGNYVYIGGYFSSADGQMLQGVCKILKSDL